MIRPLAPALLALALALAFAAPFPPPAAAADDDPAALYEAYKNEPDPARKKELYAEYVEAVKRGGGLSAKRTPQEPETGKPLPTWREEDLDRLSAKEIYELYREERNPARKKILYRAYTERRKAGETAPKPLPAARAAAPPRAGANYLADAPSTLPPAAARKKRRGFAGFLRKIEDNTEKALGALVTAGLEAGNGLSKDPALHERLNRVAPLIERAYDRDVDLKFKILNMNVVNAFACPGGTIYVTPAMLNFVTSDSELAFVLGHEAGHVAGRHSMKALEKGMAIDYLIRRTVKKGEDAARVAAAFLSLQYSRENEFEADAYGFNVMTAAGFNPHGAVTFMDKMKNMFEAKKNPEFITWLQTHPSLHDRYGRMVGMFEGVRGTNAAYQRSLAPGAAKGK